MKFKLERPLTKNDYGNTRTIAKFLWFPKKINYEIRWLESALIEQVVDSTIAIDRDVRTIFYRKFYWRDKRWINPPPNLR